MNKFTPAKWHFWVIQYSVLTQGFIHLPHDKYFIFLKWVSSIHSNSWLYLSKTQTMLSMEAVWGYHLPARLCSELHAWLFWQFQQSRGSCRVVGTGEVSDLIVFFWLEESFSFTYTLGRVCGRKCATWSVDPDADLCMTLVDWGPEVADAMIAADKRGGGGRGGFIFWFYKNKKKIATDDQYCLMSWISWKKKQNNKSTIF